MDEAKTPKKITPTYLLSFALQLGYTITIPLIIFIGGGAWLDSVLNTKPIAILIGIILGFVSSGYLLYKTIRPFMKS